MGVIFPQRVISKILKKYCKDCFVSNVSNAMTRSKKALKSIPFSREHTIVSSNILSIAAGVKLIRFPPNEVRCCSMKSKGKRDNTKYNEVQYNENTSICPQLCFSQGPRPIRI